ncbi:MAG: helicase [Burkholderiaceae bacterium]|nr:helicase [Burkholderiaceae bacterium]
MYFTIDDIRKHFEAALIQRGSEFVRNGNVCEISLVGNSIKSSVRGDGDKLFQQDILLYPTRKGINFDGVCNCAVGHNCRHVAAALIAFMEQESAAAASTGLSDALQNLPTGVASWLQRVERAAQTQRQVAEEGDAAASSYRLLFVLSPDKSGRHVLLAVCKGRLRPNGEISMASPVSELHTLLTNTPAYVKPEDLDLVRLFIAMRSGVASQATSASEPRGKIGAQLLRMLIGEQRLLWTNSYADMAKGLLFPLKEAPTRAASLTWREQGASLRLSWQFEPPVSGNGLMDYILPTNPPWYVDNLSCGELRQQDGIAAVPVKELQELVAQAPVLSADDKPVVSHLLLAQGLSAIVPLPEQVQETVREDIRPVPCLTLGSVAQLTRHGERWHDYAVLAFDYDGEMVLPGQVGPIVRERNDSIERIVRQQQAENDASQVLVAHGFAAPRKPASPLRPISGALELPSQAEWMRFIGDGLAGLVVRGWRIVKTPEYRYDLTEIDDWYAAVEDNTNEPGKNWFDLELGIVVNGERVSLLPVLVALIRNAPFDFDPQALAAHADNDQLLATLPDGRRVALPWKRVKPILGTLGELYFSDRPETDKLRLSKLDAARLAELAVATQMRWSGGENLLEIGQKLNEFGGVVRVDAPKGLNASLRDYQLDGLSWMQFLREYGFAGILADDMGLGKTIQTLSHILTEKEAGRLDKPVLVIAPTSLMSNWQDEAARFAPDLRVLLLQGKDRMPRFDLIDEHDLVLTTYALLPRDEEMLQAHEYHMIILDESQYIKNMRSKSAQAAGMLRARHRLCLTGTPLENHLGELWSQYHFLLPSLLGDEKGFNTDFRNPIEKLGDDSRRHLLTRRIKPFLLRRTKDKVAKELPPKTEVIRSVELTGAQRDLYETVRLAMDAKIRNEIAKKGVARSQIVILEALLKLRQVCCDPRLVKGGHGRINAAASAKLTELMEMLEELLAEKRSILVFSQFTSMLTLIEAELKARDIPYALLTGDTVDRASVIRSFQQGEVPLFLISLKAGGVGLNLTAADTVIHYDPWWNPATETQATDRAWRIGQDKPVFVYKLIANGTLEQKIQELQQKKADLARAMLAAGETQNVQITPEDLEAIFAPLEE